MIVSDGFRSCTFHLAQERKDEIRNKIHSLFEIFILIIDPNSELYLDLPFVNIPGPLKSGNMSYQLVKISTRLFVK
jgi:hypothetical protein